MAHVSLDPEQLHARVARRLAVRLGAESVELLCRLVEADLAGRPPLPGGLPPTAAALRDLARRLAVAHAPPVPLLQGRDVLPLGVPAGPGMGALLRAAYEAQLDGAISDRESALVWVRHRLLRTT